MDEQVLSRVCEIASDIFEADVTSDSSPETVENWDSVHNLNLVLALEEEYALQFAPEDLDQMKTLGSFARLVNVRRGA
jgi:acyl carrier protein